MLKVAVFDDEYIVLKGLQAMIDWSKYGMELVGTASDGNAALHMFEVHRPHIVFTDIRMPGLDGLQVVEKILALAPETVCTVFSGFNEFEYVKRALKLGVTDYLEKPITIPMIEDAIEKTIEKINQQKTVSVLKSKWEDSRQELLEKATLDLLLLGAEGESKWRECFGMEADKVVGVSVFALSAYVPVLKNHPACRVIPVRNGSEHLLVVFHFDGQAEELWAQLLSWLDDAGTAIGSGRTYNRVIDAPESYREALYALKYGRFIEEKGWTRFEDVGENTKLPDDLSEQEEAVIFSMRTGDKAGLLGQLHSFIHKLESEKLSPDVVEREVLKLVYLGLEVAKETGRDVYKIRQADYLPHLEIREIHTREEMFGWLRIQMEMIMDWTLEVRRATKHGAVEAACTYINKHYHRDLTLQEVSEHVGMNATYFSLLFKEEMGQSYVKYLTQLRMKRAKELLREGDKVAEVSEKVGYHSHRHFSEVFKKYIGVTPGQFKELL